MLTGAEKIRILAPLVDSLKAAAWEPTRDGKSVKTTITQQEIRQLSQKTLHDTMAEPDIEEALRDNQFQRQLLKKMEVETPHITIVSCTSFNVQGFDVILDREAAQNAGLNVVEKKAQKQTVPTHGEGFTGDEMGADKGQAR